MKWTYSIKNKTTAAILLAVILGLTMLTNLLQRKRFQELEQSFTSIYEDRLLAENYLFHLYENLKQKQDLFELAAQNGVCHTINKELNEYRTARAQLISKYTETYLTEEEDGKFNDFKTALARIDKLEEEIARLEARFEIPTELIHTHDEITAHAFSTLSALSDIQTVEGEVLRERSKLIILGSVSISHFEMTILIVIAIVIQGLIFSSSTLLVKKSQNANLN